MAEITARVGQRGYASGDVLRGEVCLRVRDSLALEGIEVELEGVAWSKVRVRRTMYNEEMYVPLEDVHRVLYESKTVFPPRNVRHLAVAREFTLAAGSYTYPFEFVIPTNTGCVLDGNVFFFNSHNLDLLLNGVYDEEYLQVKTDAGLEGAGPALYHVAAPLPPSFSKEDCAAVSYTVRATCRRSSLFKRSVEHEAPIRFTPINTARGHMAMEKTMKIPFTEDSPRGLLKMMSSRSPPKLPKRECLFVARFEYPCLVVGSQPKLKLCIVAGGEQIYLQRLHLYLRAMTTVSVAQGSEIHFGTGTKRIDLLNKKFDNLKLTGEIPTAVYDCVVPDVVPTFMTCNISRRYALAVRAGFTDSSKARKRDIAYANISVDTDVLSGGSPPSYHFDPAPRYDPPTYDTLDQVSCRNSR